jgi:hypothetical protein
MFGTRMGRAAMLGLILLLNMSSLSGQELPQGNALWVAESGGALKLATTDGHLILEIGNASSARAIAVDHRRNSTWFYAGRTLYSYSSSGTKQLSMPLTDLPVSLPLVNVPEADLAVFEEDGSVWLAVGHTLVSLSSSGQRLHTLQLPENITLRTSPLTFVVAPGHPPQPRCDGSGRLDRRSPPFGLSGFSKASSPSPPIRAPVPFGR